MGLNVNLIAGVTLFCRVQTVNYKTVVKDNTRGMFDQNIKEDISWKCQRKGTKWLCWSSIWICLNYSCPDHCNEACVECICSPSLHSQLVRYQCFVPSSLIQRHTEHSLENLACSTCHGKDSCNFLILWCILRKEKMTRGVEGWAEFSFYLEDLESCLKADVSRFLHLTTCWPPATPLLRLSVTLENK